MSDDPFDAAMSEQEAKQAEEQSDSDDGTEFGDDPVVSDFLDRMGDSDRVKNETIGIAVNEEMKAVWSQLRRPADEGGIDVDVTQSVRNHIETLAYRHEDATERAIRKYEIDRE